MSTDREPDSTTCGACGGDIAPRAQPRGQPKRWCSTPCAQRGAWRARHDLPVSDEDYLAFCSHLGAKRSAAATTVARERREKRARRKAARAARRKARAS